MSVRSLDTVRTKCRTFQINRSPQFGYGFVAGSERPTIIKQVIRSGPSYGFLCSGDAIVAINGFNVEQADGEDVIRTVKNCESKMEITIRRLNGGVPPFDQPRHSSLASVQQMQINQHVNSQTLNRRDKLPNRSTTNDIGDDNNKPLMRSATLGRNHIIKAQQLQHPPQVIKKKIMKVYLENGQTKTFEFDDSTTVRDVLESLHSKLGFKYHHYFGLAVDHLKRPQRNQLHVLDNDDALAKISKIRDAADLLILYRVMFPPSDVNFLRIHDPQSFDYLYQQTFNDIKLSRYLPELRAELIFKLVSIHIVQHVRATYAGLNAKDPKIILKTIAKEPGIERFVPKSILASVKKPKKLARILLEHIKKNIVEYELLDKSSSEIKLTLLEIVSQLPSFGAKLFISKPTNSRILINDKFGICLIETNANNSSNNNQQPGVTNRVVNGGNNGGNPISLAKIDQIQSVRLLQRPEMCIAELNLISANHTSHQPIKLSIANEDQKEFVTTLRGYYRSWHAAHSPQRGSDDQENYELKIYCSKWPEKTSPVASSDSCTSIPARTSLQHQQSRSVTPVFSGRQMSMTRTRNNDHHDTTDTGSHSRVLESPVSETCSTTTGMSSKHPMSAISAAPTPRSSIIIDEDSDEMHFPPPPPSIGANPGHSATPIILNQDEFMNNMNHDISSIHGSRSTMVNDDICTMSSMSPEDASISLETDNSSSRSDFPSEYNIEQDDEHIYANTGRSFPGQDQSHSHFLQGDNNNDRLHVIYRNKMGYNINNHNVDRTSTPSSSSTYGAPVVEITDLTNHRQIQINIDKDRHMVITQHDSTIFSPKTKNSIHRNQITNNSVQTTTSGLTNGHSHNGNNHGSGSTTSDNTDLNDLLTELIVPPPPTSQESLFTNGYLMSSSNASHLAIKASTELLTYDDIMSLIVPPPPPEQNIVHEHLISTNDSRHHQRC